MIVMKNIIIVQCTSTGINYVQDIIDRNYNPVVLELKPSDDTEEAMIIQEEIRHNYELIEPDFELIYEKDSYEDTLEMVKDFDPLLIIPGTEEGVVLATKLANDLNLLCNPIENLDSMTLKNEMHNRLAQNNPRSIKGHIIQNVEEAIEYYDSENLDEVVIKPLYSAASVGVKICQNRNELIESVNEILNSKNYYGDEIKELLIQEKINGDEYVINTVSCNGVHRVTTIWKYHKIKTSEGGQIYDYDETVNELNIGEAELVEYAYDVNDTLGIKYGPVHGEYMIDEKGPVLIEVNCRPHGGHLDAKMMDRISGKHETDSSLDSYLNPDKFYQERQKPYTLFAYGIIKSIIVPKDMTAKSSPLKNIGQNLKSYHKTLLRPTDTPQSFIKTQNMETSPGDIYLVHEDKNLLQNDLEFIRNLEKRAFELIYSEETPHKIDVDNDKLLNDIKSLANNLKSHGTTLLITDEIYDDLNIIQTNAHGLNEIIGEFDCV